MIPTLLVAHLPLEHQLSRIPIAIVRMKGLANKRLALWMRACGAFCMHHCVSIEKPEEIGQADLRLLLQSSTHSRVVERTG